MQKCSKCNNPGKIKVQANTYCPRCFASITLRRISKHLRETGSVKKGSHVLVLGKLTDHVFRLIIKSIPINITFMQLKSFNIQNMDDDVFSNKELLDFIRENSIDSVMLPWTIEDELRHIWSDISQPEGKSADSSERFTKLFLPAMDYEIKELAKYYSIDTDDLNLGLQKSEIDMLFDELEDRYLGAKFGFYKSFKELRELE